MTFDPETIIPPGARIKVIGVGGGGGNAVNTMIRSGLEGVDFVTCNTDVQALKFSLAGHKIQIGKALTRGLGAGADPDVGRDAALEDRHEIQDYLTGADMVFITAGMGGGTGTGGAAVVAQIARELGALTVAVVTKPFNFEGKRRKKHSECGIARLRECVDTLITIPNQRLLQVAAPGVSMIEAFKMADDVLVNAVKGISDIINIPGTVNVDFADVKTVMSCMGQALMGIGRARGEGRALEAARQAICSPLLEDIDIEGATGILINITAGADITLMEVNEACSIIQEAAHEDANIIFGAVIDETLGDEIRVTVIATGFPAEAHDGDSQEPVIVKPMTSIIQPFGAARLTMPTKPLTRPAAPQHVPQPVAQPTPPATQPPVRRAEVAPAPTAQPAPLAPPIPVVSAQVAAQAVPTMHQIQQEPVVRHVDPQPAPMSLALDPISASEPPLPMTDEAQTLAAWTLGSFDDPLSLAEQLSGEMSSLTELTTAPAELPVEARLEGASVILDQQDEFALLAGETEPPASPLSVFETGASEDDLVPLAPEPHRAGAEALGSAPLESFFQDEGSALIATDIDRKIDEALELAGKLRTVKQSSQENGDDLDVPAFLRQGVKDLTLG